VGVHLRQNGSPRFMTESVSMARFTALRSLWLRQADGFALLVTPGLPPSLRRGAWFPNGRQLTHICSRNLPLTAGRGLIGVRQVLPWLLFWHLGKICLGRTHPNDVWLYGARGPALIPACFTDSLSGLRRELVLDAAPEPTDTSRRKVPPPAMLMLGALTALTRLELFGYDSDSDGLTRQDPEGSGEARSRPNVWVSL